MNYPKNGMKTHELILITDLDFDSKNGASYNRIGCYISAFKGNHISIKVLSTMYDYSANMIETIEIDNAIYYKGVKLSSKSTFDDFKFLRSWKFIFSIEQVTGSKLLQHESRAYFLHTASFANNLMILLILKIFKKQRVFIEKNELKTAVVLNYSTRSNSFIKRISLLFIKLLLLIPSALTDFFTIFFSGIIVISESLFRLYSPFTKQIIKIPILVNQSAVFRDFRNIKANKSSIFESKAFNIGYFGHIGEEKDGLFSLIDAILNLSGANINLFIFGSGNRINVKRIIDISKNSKQIVYCGMVNSNEVLINMQKYDLLAFPRPKNLQTKFGFSTKLAEFLYSGIPTLTSDVSDNKLYLVDNENAFLIQAEKRISVSKLIERIRTIYDLKNEDLIRVGMNGHLTARDKFSPLLYSEVLNQFIFNGLYDRVEKIV